LGLLAGTQQQASIDLGVAPGTDLSVQFTNSNSAAVAVPSQVIIPAGSRSVSFAVSGLGAGTSMSAGRAVIEASAPGYETASLVVQVLSQPAGNLSLAITGGNNQAGPPGTSLPQALRVSVQDGNQIPYPGQRVNFAIVNGDATVSPAAVDTDFQGNALAQAQLGTTTGPVTIRASFPGTPLFVDFSLTALGLPQLPPEGVVNGASLAPGPAPVAPGSIISLFGTNLAGTIASAQSFPLPPKLAGTSVEIGGIAAPLLYVSPLQINAQVPFELTASTVSVTVRNSFGASPPISLTLQSTDPGIFAADSTGRGPGAITHNSTQQLVTSQNPAVPGEFVQIFATGLGPVQPAVASGTPAPSQPPASTTLLATVMMNGLVAPVPFAGLAPGFAGLYQVNAQVPEIPPGDVNVVLTINGVSSPPVTMAVGSR